MSWFWRTKPRSIIKTIHWFPYFAALKGENWNAQSDSISKFTKKAVYPIRRNFIYHAHSEEDQWLSHISYEDYLSGKKDIKETESNGRNDKTTFEFLGFGYVNKEGLICITEVGNSIVQGNFDQEDYLKQLLKLHLPNIIQKTKDKGDDVGVFPFQLVLKAFEHFDSLNRSELALLFGCTKIEDVPVMLHAIAEFKERYEALKNKNNTKEVKHLFQTVYLSHYKEMQNQVNSYYDYAEAFSRTLLYTGLFSISGRSIATKIRIAKHSQKKLELLQKNYSFLYPNEFSDIDSYMSWFGSATNVILPWENLSARKELIEDKVNILSALLESADFSHTNDVSISPSELKRILEETKGSQNSALLKNYETIIHNAITNYNEDYFIKISSKTKTERKNILEKFDDILANEDMSALWLEVNTWKSLIAVNGTQTVKRNFKIEDDLSPRSFAPGVGNTPDMELYKDNYMIIPEVSLMTGVRQWEHEASSVIDHVLHAIKSHHNKQVIGLFISSRIHERTLWQFFILNRESWVGQPVPVIPLTIIQYVDIITFLYENNLDIDFFKALLEYLSKSCHQYSHYQEWEKHLEKNIKSWKSILLNHAPAGLIY